MASNRKKGHSQLLNSIRISLNWSKNYDFFLAKLNLKYDLNFQKEIYLFIFLP